jgi:hypothetical protein
MTALNQSVKALNRPVKALNRFAKVLNQPESPARQALHLPLLYRYGLSAPARGSRYPAARSLIGGWNA